MTILHTSLVVGTCTFNLFAFTNTNATSFHSLSRMARVNNKIHSRFHNSRFFSFVNADLHIHSLRIEDIIVLQRQTRTAVGDFVFLLLSGITTPSSQQK